jgi:hypothetical protein
MRSIDAAATRGNASPALESRTLMRMLLTDLALLERLEEHCREALDGVQSSAALTRRITSAAAIARRLTRCKELVASELLLQQADRPATRANRRKRARSPLARHG